MLGPSLHMQKKLEYPSGGENAVSWFVPHCLNLGCLSGIFVCLIYYSVH